MISTYRPHLRLEGEALRSVLASEVAKRADRLHLPHLDEDEATLALEAALPLLEAAGLPAADLKSLHVTSRAETTWLETFVLGLGAGKVSAASLPFEEWESERKRKAPDGGPSLWIRSEAPRAGSADLEKRGLDALATAELRGDGFRVGPDLRPQSHRPPRRVDRAFYDRLARWDVEAPTRVPMGANIPQATWDSSREARLRLLASTCSACGASHHPPLDPCPRCGRPTSTAPLPRIGRIYSYTTIAKGGAPSEFDAWQELEGEYGVGIVEFDRRVRIAGMLTESALSSLAIGEAVEPVLRRLYAQEGRWRHGIKFRTTRNGT